MDPIMTLDETKVVDLFFTLAQIDAVSRQERGMADFLRARFDSLDGAVVEEDSAASRSAGNAGNLVLRISGQGSPLLLGAHMDTVASTAQLVPRLEAGILRSDGTTILGADNRAGIAAILYVLEMLPLRTRPHRPLEVVFTVAEEVGMLGALALDMGHFKAQQGYIFDCSREPGAYVRTSPTALDFNLQFKGRAAHSGVSPEKGVNALSMALATLSGIPVGRVDQETVANIGRIEGGQAINVVPDYVSATGEIRSFNRDTLDQMVHTIQHCAQTVEQQYHGTIGVTVDVGFEGFYLNDTRPVIQRLKRAYKQLDLTGAPLTYSGGSDANVFNARGIETVNLGIGARNPHSNQEEIALSDLMTGIQLIDLLIDSEA
jgi:tripeptide aminopeptidase